MQEQIRKAYRRVYAPGNIVRALRYRGRHLRAAVNRAAVGFGEKTMARAIDADGYIEELRRIEAPYYRGNEFRF